MTRNIPAVEPWYHANDLTRRRKPEQLVINS